MSTLLIQDIFGENFYIWGFLNYISGENFFSLGKSQIFVFGKILFKGEFLQFGEFYGKS